MESAPGQRSFVLAYVLSSQVDSVGVHFESVRKVEEGFPFLPIASQNIWGLQQSVAFSNRSLHLWSKPFEKEDPMKREQSWK